MSRGDIKTVYFAGKVSKNGGYRGKLFNNNLVMSDGYERYRINGGELVYGGPFALSCDHGCFHRAGSHGLVDNAGCMGILDGYEDEFHGGFFDGFSQPEAVARCLHQIYNADAVHVYLDTVSCYGTLVELGYASAFNKPIYIYFKENAKNWKKHFWFATNLPNVKHCGVGLETSIHPDLIKPGKSFKERYHEYLNSKEWKSRRAATVAESGNRCQLCNGNGKIHVHHRTYDRVFNELPEDLVALCSKCHEKFHDLPTNPGESG